MLVRCPLASLDGRSGTLTFTSECDPAEQEYEAPSSDIETRLGLDTAYSYARTALRDPDWTPQIRCRFEPAAAREIATGASAQLAALIACLATRREARPGLLGVDALWATGSLAGGRVKSVDKRTFAAKMERFRHEGGALLCPANNIKRKFAHRGDDGRGLKVIGLRRWSAGAETANWLDHSKAIVHIEEDDLHELVLTLFGPLEQDRDHYRVARRPTPTRGTVMFVFGLAIAAACVWFAISSIERMWRAREDRQVCREVARVLQWDRVETLDTALTLVGSLDTRGQVECFRRQFSNIAVSGPAAIFGVIGLHVSKADKISIEPIFRKLAAGVEAYVDSFDQMRASLYFAEEANSMTIYPEAPTEKEISGVVERLRLLDRWLDRLPSTDKFEAIRQQRRLSDEWEYSARIWQWLSSCALEDDAAPGISTGQVMLDWVGAYLGGARARFQVRSGTRECLNSERDYDMCTVGGRDGCGDSCRTEGIGTCVLHSDTSFGICVDARRDQE